MASNINSSRELLWGYARSLYEQGEIAKVCLQLQDEYTANVNVLLFADWLQSHRVALTSERLIVALNTIEKWDVDYVQVLRNLRRTMKPECVHSNEVAAVRDQIKHAELLAEKYELHLLEKVAQEWQPQPNKVFNNLRLYLNYLEVPDQKIVSITPIFNLRKI